MSWRDEMQVASFRGVPFGVTSSERSGGRRAVVHEFPFRNVPFAEDLGRKARPFTVDGFVVGSDYRTQRDALLTALEGEGSGSLTHPYHGTRTVQVISFRVRETAERGGLAEFSMEFMETAAEPIQPTAVPDVKGAVLASVDAAQTSVATEFESTFSPGALLDSVSAALGSFTATVRTVLSTVSTGEQVAASLVKHALDIEQSASALISVPANLQVSIADLISTFEAGSENALFALYNFGTGVRPPATTTNRQIEQQNFDALRALIQRLVAIQLAALAIDRAYDSYESAVVARDAITALLDEQAETTSDDTFPALSQLRAALVRAVPGEDSTLPHLLHVPLLAPTNSLALAYRLYGDLSLEADLIARNSIRDPGNVPGGLTLEVLSDG